MLEHSRRRVGFLFIVLAFGLPLLVMMLLPLAELIDSFCIGCIW